MAGTTRFYHKIVDSYFEWWDHSSLSDTYYNVKNFLLNVPMFLKMAYNYRSWDYSYTLNILVSLLKDNAKACKNGHSVNAENTYRRGMTAAGLIEKAYNRDVDRSMAYLLRKNPVIWSDKSESGYIEMKTGYLKNQALYDKMYEVARKRDDTAEAQAKKEAWQYLNKYIEHLWD